MAVEAVLTRQEGNSSSSMLIILFVSLRVLLLCWELPWVEKCGNGCWEEFHPMGGERPMGAFFKIDNPASKSL